MPAHYGYNPPPGTVVDQQEPRANWSGAGWTLNGRPYAVPASHHLVGKAGTAMAGWHYDSTSRAWIEPDRPSAPAARSPLSMAHPLALPAAHAPLAAPPAPVQPQPTQVPAHEPEKEMHLEKPQTVLEDLIKHPVAPVLGGLLWLAPMLTDEPQPPVIPDGLPEVVQKQWQMIFAQNQQRYQQRMQLWGDLGKFLLGYSGARSIVDVIGSHHHHMLGDKRAA